MRKTTSLKLLAAILFCVTGLLAFSPKVKAEESLDLTAAKTDAEGNGWKWSAAEQTLYLYGAGLDSVTLPGGATVRHTGINRLNGTLTSTKGSQLFLTGSGILQAVSLNPGDGIGTLAVDGGIYLIGEISADKMIVQSGYVRQENTSDGAGVKIMSDYSQSGGYVSLSNAGSGRALDCGGKLELSGGYLECSSGDQGNGTVKSASLTQSGGVFRSVNTAEGLAYSGGAYKVSSGVSIINGGPQSAHCRLQTSGSEKVWYDLAPSGSGKDVNDAAASDYGCFVVAKSVTNKTTSSKPGKTVDSLYYSGSDTLYLKDATLTGGAYVTGPVDCRTQLAGKGTLVATKGLLFKNFDEKEISFSGTAVGKSVGTKLDAGIVFENNSGKCAILNNNACYVGIGNDGATYGVYAKEGLKVGDAALIGVGSGFDAGGIYAGTITLEKGASVTALSNDSYALESYDTCLNGGSLSAASTGDRAVNGKVHPGSDGSAEIAVYGGNYAAYDGTVFADGAVSGHVYKGMTDLGKEAYTYTAEDIQQIFNTKVIYSSRNTSVTGVKMDKTEAELVGLGAELELKATVLPDTADNQSLFWSSNAPAVAKVDQKGTVTAVGEGKAEITAETEEGGFKAVCTVTVTVPKYKVTVTGGHTMDEYGNTRTEYAEGETVSLVLDTDLSGADCSFSGWYPEKGNAIIDTANSAYSAWFIMPAEELTIGHGWKIERISVEGYEEPSEGKVARSDVRLAQAKVMMSIDSAEWTDGKGKTVTGKYAGGTSYTLKLVLKAGENMSFGAKLNQKISLGGTEAELQSGSAVSSDGKTATLIFAPVVLGRTEPTGETETKPEESKSPAESTAAPTKGTEPTKESEPSTEDPGGKEEKGPGKTLVYALIVAGAVLVSFGIGFLIGRNSKDEEEFEEEETVKRDEEDS